MPREDVNKGDLIWGFIGQMQWSSGIVVEVYKNDDYNPERDGWAHDRSWIGRRVVYGVLWSNGTFSEHFRHELSLPHEVAKEA